MPQNSGSQTFRLGAFILVGLAILAAAVFLIGSQESKFVAHILVNAQFQNVAGLEKKKKKKIFFFFFFFF